jgi:hypothetical protein
MILLDLADACRKSGLEVIEIDGWRTRGHHETGEIEAVETIVCHHTATPLGVAGDYPTLRTVRDGRSDLPGPLAQLGLGRSGTVYVIAAGVCFHAGATFSESQDNWHAIGIEAEHDGVSPWPPAIYDAYILLCAALAAHYGLDEVRVQGHKEIAEPLGRKTDPNFDMFAFRDRVRNQMEDNVGLSADDKAWIVAALDQRLLIFAKTAGETIKVDGDGDPDTPKVSLERKLQNLGDNG